MRTAKIFFNDLEAGILAETETGYTFGYHWAYIKNGKPPISLTLPLQHEIFFSNIMFPFFDGLIPEGWLLEIVTENWKISPRDRMGLLLACCRDTIGAVTVLP